MRYVSLSLLTLACALPACRTTPAPGEQSEVPRPPPPRLLTPNLAHLEHLYDEIVLPAGDTGGVVWIYCEAPDYTLLDDDDEGYTCVDDMARALVAYAMHYELRGDALSRKRVTQLARTILSLQADNGYFYNFLWPDNTINRDFKTSVAEPDWWSWRALWALEVALSQNLLDEADASAAEAACGRVVVNVARDFPLAGEPRDTIIAALRLPNDLPAGGGADQVAVLVMGLSRYAARTGDTTGRSRVSGFAERLMAMQTAGGRSLSWYNHWHAWGNSQSYALQAAGRQFGEGRWAQAGRREVSTFLPEYLAAGRVAEGVATSRAITPHVPARLPQMLVWRYDTFPQIAYGRRPMVWAALEAARQTGDSVYVSRAEQAAAWFSGDNVAGVPMYDPTTGRGYDGIISATEVNYNAGAESTIEALLSVLALAMAEKEQ